MSINKTFKEYVAEKISDIAVDEHGDGFSKEFVFDNFDDFMQDVSKEELLVWGDEFKQEK